MGSRYKYNPIEDAFDIAFDDDLGASQEELEIAQNNIVLNAFKIASVGDLAVFKMDNMVIDEYEDESGIDLVNSNNIDYDASGYYSPTATIESHTKMLLHCDGDPILDVAGYSTVVLNNNAQILTGDPKFTPGNVNFPNAQSDTAVATSATQDFNLGKTGTIDFWFKGSDWSQDYTGLLTTTYWQLNIHHNTFHFPYNGEGSAGWKQNYSDAFPFTIQTGVWYHAEISYDPAINTIRYFINGIAVGSDVVTTNFNPGVCSFIQMGAGGAGVVYTLDIDELRYSDIVRHTTSFTPETSPYSSDVEPMNLISEAVTAETEPTEARLILLEEDVDDIEINTDLMVYVSKDDGVTWALGTMEVQGDAGSNKTILSASFDLTASGIGSGTELRYKYITANSKIMNIHATSLIWK